MRLLEPPGWPWLLAHEIRVGWRSAGGIRSTAVLVLLAVLVVAAHGAAWGLHHVFDVEAALRKFPGLVYGGTVFMLLLILSFAFGIGVRALIERGDYDLLLSSPVRPATIYTVRGIAIGVTAIATPGLFWLPFANLGPFMGRPETLAAYPVLLAMGLGCAAIALAVTLVLVRWLGLRRARVFAQILGALIGATLILGMQVPQLLDPSTLKEIRVWIAGSPLLGAAMGPGSVLGWPLRALAGELVPAITVVAIGVGTFALVVRLTQSAFIAALQETPSEAAPPGDAGSKPYRAFRSGLASLVISKELRLIRRDPALIGMTLLQVLYLVPIFLLLLRNHEMTRVLAPSLVMLAASLAGNLAWIAVSGEEAPDLLDSAPVSSAGLRRYKVAAALAPVAVMLIPVLAWYASRSLSLALVVAAFVTVASASSAWVQVTVGRPGGGRDLKRRKQDIGVNLVEGVGSIGWAAGCWFALGGSPWALACIAVGCAAPLAVSFVPRRAEPKALS